MGDGAGGNRRGCRFGSQKWACAPRGGQTAPIKPQRWREDMASVGLEQCCNRVVGRRQHGSRGAREVHAALSIVEEREVPLARWRVLATAADICAANGDAARTAELRAATHYAVSQLAQSM